MTRRPGRGVSGLRPASSPTAASRRGRRGTLAELSPAARALLEHVDGHGGEAHHRVGPAHRAARRRAHARRGAAGPPAAGAPRGRRHGRACPARSASRCAAAARPASRSTRCRRWPRRRVEPHWSTRTAAGAAFEAVRRLELLLDHWGAAAAGGLRSGGLGVRDLKAAARAAARRRGRRGPARRDGAGRRPGRRPRPPPTGRPVVAAHRRVRRLVAAGRPPSAGRAWPGAWLASPRMPGAGRLARPGGQDLERARPRARQRGLAEEARRIALAGPGRAARGEVLAIGHRPRLAGRSASRWLRPRRPRTRADQVAWTRWPRRPRSASPALGGPAAVRPRTAGRVTTTGRRGGARRRCSPTRSTTCCCRPTSPRSRPGPLESELARRLQLLADVESRGGATVYRFTPGSRAPRARRGLDGGRAARLPRRRSRGRRCRSR